MSFTDVAQNLDLPTYKKLKTAIELGKWPTGVALTQEQKSICLEATLTYEAANMAPEERTGFIDSQCKSKSNEADLITKQ